MDIIKLFRFHMSRGKNSKLVVFLLCGATILLGYKVYAEWIPYLKYRESVYFAVLNFYPVIYIKEWIFILIPILMILITCDSFVSGLESKNIILPFFQGYSRKRILFSNWLFVNLLILFFFFLILVISLLLGIPFRSFYFEFQELYTESVPQPPLNLSIIILSVKVLFSQYIVYNILIQITCLFGVMFRNRIKAGIAALLFYFMGILLNFFVPQLEKFIYINYANKFIALQTSAFNGDAMYITHLETLAEYLMGFAVCLVPALVVCFIMRYKFLKLEF